MACVFIACEFSQRVNNAFNELEEKITQLKWYRFPIKNKRMLPLIMGFLQQPVALECFGSIFCCREVFKNVSSKTIQNIYTNEYFTEFTFLSFLLRL